MKFCVIKKGNKYLNVVDKCIIRIDNIDYKSVYFSIIDGYTTINTLRFQLHTIFHMELIPYIDMNEEMDKL